MFSRHITRNIKSIEHALFELQDFYNFSVDMDTKNLHQILVKIKFPKNIEKFLIDFAEKDLRKNLDYFWKWQSTDYKTKSILICLKSIL